MLPAPSEAVIFRELSEGGVLFHTGQEVYFGLNDVGCVVWKLLPPTSTSLDEICLRLRERYPSVTADALRADVVELLDELERFGLVAAKGAAGDDETASFPPS